MPFKQTVVSACPMNKTLFNKLQKCFKMKKKYLYSQGIYNIVAKV